MKVRHIEAETSRKQVEMQMQQLNQQTNMMQKLFEMFQQQQRQPNQ